MKRCRHCNKQIRDDALACPFCLKSLEAPGVPASQASIKKCPYCAEDIQQAAIVCRFCGKDLEAPEPIYYPVSATKFIVLSLCSFGIYQVFWFYRNWKLEKARTGEDAWPFWRAVFAPLFAFSLFGRIRNRASEAAVPVGYAPDLLAVAYLLLNLTWRLPDPYSWIGLFAFVPLLPVRSTIGKINRTQVPGAWSNSWFSLSDFGVLIGSWLIVVGVFLGQLTLAPGPFKEPYVREFTDTCTKASVSRGSPEVNARRLCACTAQDYADHFTGYELLSQSWQGVSPESQKAVADARDTCGQRFKADFNASYVGTYVKSCQQVAAAKGPPETETGPWCGCMAQHLLEHHTPRELARFDQDVSSHEVKEATTAAGNACLQHFFLNNFTNSCTQAAVSKGSVEAQIKFCSCLAQRLVDNHAPAELAAFTLEADSPATLKAVQQAVAACSAS